MIPTIQQQYSALTFSHESAQQFMLTFFSVFCKFFEFFSKIQVLCVFWVCHLRFLLPWLKLLICLLNMSLFVRLGLLLIKMIYCVPRRQDHYTSTTIGNKSTLATQRFTTETTWASHDLHTHHILLYPFIPTARVPPSQNDSLIIVWYEIKLAN